MDILTHVLSGVAAGTVVAAYSGAGLYGKAAVVGCGAFGGLLPDMDVVTRWSGFDSTVGKLFGLNESGREIYFNNHWYSHHNFTHSLASALLAGCGMIVLAYAINMLSAKKRDTKTGLFKRSALFGIAAFFGYVAHLLGDLPTPPGPWGGINLFWPLNSYAGGTGEVWWWNNYDILLLVGACCVANIVLLLAGNTTSRSYLKHAPAFVVAATLVVAAYQITHRPVDFSGRAEGSAYADKDRASLEIQRDILGERLFKVMNRICRRLEGYGVII